MEYFLYCQSVTAFLIGVAVFGCAFLIFKLIRVKFPVRVVCWFCGKKSTVPFGNCNCWDCPHCEQYNGFKKDGDYNKPIPAQWSTELNYPISCTKQKMDLLSNGLCSACNERQLLKVQQLAVFKPFVESNYNNEVNNYKEHLEKIYNLCYKCKLYVQQELERLDVFLKMKYPHALSGSILSSASSLSTFSNSTSSQSSVLTSVHDQLPSVLEMFSFASAVTLLILYICQIYSAVIATMVLPVWVVQLWQLLSRNINFIAIFGLFFCLASKFLFLGKVSLYIGDVVDALVWLLLNVLSLMILHDVPATPTVVVLHCGCHVVNAVSTCLCFFWPRAKYENQDDLEYHNSFTSQASLSDSSLSGSPKPVSMRSYHTANSSAGSYKTYSTSPLLRRKPLYSPLHPLHRSKSTASLASFPVRKPSWRPLSVQTNFPPFSSGSRMDIPSFGSLSRASGGAGFNKSRSPSANIFSSYSSTHKRCFSANSSLNQFNTSRFSTPSATLSRSLTDDQHSSILDKILGLKMDNINLGRSFNASKSSMSSSNRWPRSPPSLLSRGDIAPARLICEKIVSSSGTYLDKNSLSSSKFSSSNQFNDTASVFSDSFSIKPSDSKSCHEFDSEDQLFEKSERQNDLQSSMKKSNTDFCLVDSTTDSPMYSTARTKSKAVFLAFSITVNVVLILIVLLRDFPLSSSLSLCVSKVSHYTKHVTELVGQFLTDNTWLHQ